MMKNRVMQISSLLLMTGLVSACSNLPGLHKTVILQGNQIEDTRLEQIKPGMAQLDVQRILGTPLVRDPYHPNVWHYTFMSTLSTGEQTAQQNVKVTFDKNKRVQSVERLQ
mgnify:FL=1